MNNRIRRIESYEEYKVEIASWLIKNIGSVPNYMMKTLTPTQINRAHEILCNSILRKQRTPVYVDNCTLFYTDMNGNDQTTAISEGERFYIETGKEIER